MPILTSPSVAVTEKDYSQIVPFAATGAGAVVGEFSMGPIDQPIQVSSINQLEDYFGRPTESNYKEWWTAWNFLQYSGSLWVSRIGQDTMRNSSAGTGTAILIKNAEDYLTKTSVELAAAGDFICKQPGAIGNALKIVMVDNNTWTAFINDSIKKDSYSISAAAISSDVATYTLGSHPYQVGDKITVTGFTGGDAIYNVSSQTVTAITSTTVSIALVNDDDTAASVVGAKLTGVSLLVSESRHLSAYLRTGQPTTTEFMSVTMNNPDAKDEIHVFIIDATGAISGVAGRILELHEGLSKVANVTDYLGRNIYYANFLNQYSDWVYWSATPTFTDNANTVVWGSLTNAATTGTLKQLQAIYNESFDGGVSSNFTTRSAKGAAVQTGLDLFRNKEEISLAYIMTVDYPVETVHYAVSIAEQRRDCVVFVSANNDGVPFINKSTAVTDVQTFRDITLNVNSSYAFLDSGYKYQFDGYNQKYRWIPLNGDIAGLCARLDSEYESWNSPGGFTRGVIKNVIKLSTPLDQAARDVLYPKQVNAVVSFPGKGTVLFGDRTMQAKPSAFQSYHIRRLFIILEKSIQDAAAYQLFELNNAATRSRFRGMIEPFLASVRARDGLADFKVVCDGSNNTDDTVARGEFVADIYIKPLYSIQYVILNFVATKSSVQFNQVISAAAQ